LISLWKNKAINIFLLDISEQPTTITGYCQFNYYINYTELSGDGKRLLCYSNVNSTLQIWELNFLVDKIELISKNIKAHQGYVICAGFYNNQYAISCSLDQTLKVWNC
jgi:WD40 repeat protein